ncbi:MAG TPA: hypothetical protein VLX09_18505 [Stellaceae bacterium]|nr:hypothetical protein [Stellaceae bacterium]
MSLRPHIRPFAWIVALWLLGSLLLPAWANSDAVFAFMFVAPGLIMVALLILGIAWLAVPIAAAALIRRRFRERRYAAVAACSVVLLAAFPLAYRCREVSAFLRFQWEKPAYDDVVADAVAGLCTEAELKRWHAHIVDIDCDAPVLVVFNWGSFLSVWRGVVYDASDQIMKEPSKRDAAWQKRGAGELLGCSQAEHRLGGHYYLASGDFTSGEPCE